MNLCGERFAKRCRRCAAYLGRFFAYDCRRMLGTQRWGTSRGLTLTVQGSILGRRRRIVVPAPEPLLKCVGSMCAALTSGVWSISADGVRDTYAAAR